MKKILIIFYYLHFSIVNHFFFEEYKIIETKILKNNDKFYKVKKGDNLYSISKKFNIPIQKIIKYNKIKSPFKIYPNQKIILPKIKSTL